MIVYGRSGQQGLGIYYFGSSQSAAASGGATTDCDVYAISHMGITPVVAIGVMGADAVAETELC